MTARQILEIFIYELVDLTPNLLLTILLFKNQFRFYKIPSVFFIILLYLMITLSRIAALSKLSYAAFLSALWVLLYLFFYFICIRVAVTKLLFVLLTILNYCSFVVIIFSYLTFHKFTGISAFPYSIFSSMVLLCIYLITYPVISLLLLKKARPLLNNASINTHWRYLWLVPATFCLAYYYNLYTNGGIIAYSASIGNVVFALLFNAGALFVTYLILKLIEENHTANILKEENAQLTMQFLQFENLKGRMEETRRANHDLRQNMTVIQSYLRDDDRDGLMRFIGQYVKTLPPDSPIAYCHDYTLNALIGYYAHIAGEQNIDFDAEIQYPDNICISDSDKVVMFGNLLENAIEACLRGDISQRFITLRIKPQHNMLLITLDNSYSGNISKRGNSFISSKSNRVGIGITSIQKIVDKYQGIVKLDYDDHVFHTSILMNGVFPCPTLI